MGAYLAFQVSVGVGAMMIAAAVLIHILPGLWARRPLKWVPYAELPLVFSGSAGLLGATVAGYSAGGLLNTGITLLVNTIGGIAPAVATVVLAVAALFAIAFFIHDVIKKDPSTRAMVSAVSIPLTIGAIPGAFGAFFVAVFGWMCTALIYVFVHLFGVG